MPIQKKHQKLQCYEYTMGQFFPHSRVVRPSYSNRINISIHLKFLEWLPKMREGRENLNPFIFGKANPH